ncbi:MAG TPA: hypothetical protein VK388_11415, partial [Pyrinomonadaceae bacterium]|nr:hypothetical protein [Pyrinomonadaceae bacterium]
MRPHVTTTSLLSNALRFGLLALFICALAPAPRAQEEKQTEREAVEKARQDEAKKAETEKPKPDETKKAEEAKKPADPLSAPTFAGLRMRLIGPAFTSGRVVGIAVDPKDKSRYYVAAGSGGVWKTVNAGTTWTPVFDNEGSYSIGVVVLDPKNPLTVWVGTGENNSQRSVSYGNGVYRSDDGG